MRWTILLLIASLMQVSAVTMAQRITLNEHNASLESVLKEIRKQSGYDLFYDGKILSNNYKVTVSLTKASVAQALNSTLKGLPLTYSIQENTIVLRRKEADLSSAPSALQLVKGVVRDSAGEALTGVSVVNLNRKSGTATDATGRFQLEAEVGDVLRFSSLGYVPQELRLGTQVQIEIILLKEEAQMDVVVVTALGIQRKEKSLSYNVQQVDGADVATVKNSNFIGGLVGKVAGAQINPGANGPGGAVKVVMRGSKSIALDNNVLYVIDGIPMNNAVQTGGDGQFTLQPGTESIADLNPEDIESMSVMSGPSASALYGSQGANGVILITTKKGIPNRTTLSFSNNTMFSSPLLLPDFQNRYGNLPGEVMSWGNETAQRFDPASFFNTGTNVSNAVALSTGTERSQNYLSIASNNATGILPNNRYNRYNFGYRNTTNFLDDKLVFNLSANYIIQNDRNMVSQGQYFNPLPALYLFPRGDNFSSIQQFERYDPVTEVNRQYWPYGDQSLSIQNPYWTMYRMNRDTERKRYMFTTTLRYNITDDWSVTGRVNLDNTDMENTHDRYASTLGALAGPKGRHVNATRKENQVYADFIASYRKTVSDFSFNVDLGTSIRDHRMDATAIEGDLDQITNYFALGNLSRAVGTFKLEQDGLHRRINSVFGNAEIGYKGLLFLTLTNRIDWDSALAFSLAGQSYYDYPSAGISAVFSDMFSLPNWFNYLKGRGSYTAVGNSYLPYLTTLQYMYDPQTNTYQMTRTRPNFQLLPEKTVNYEAGFDMRFFENRLSLEATFYQSNTTRQTHNIPESGIEYDSRIIQTGNVQNRGLELMLGYTQTWNKFKWSSNLTYSVNKNKIISLYGSDIQRENPDLAAHVDRATLGSIGSPIVRLTENGTMGDIYMTSDFTRDNNGFIFLDPSTLLPSIRMLNSDEFQRLGTLLPTTFIGFRNAFTYRNFQLQAVLSARLGGLVVSNTQAILDRYGVSEYSAVLREQDNVVIHGNEISTQNYLNVVAEGTGRADFYTYSANNVRLQELSLAYTIDRNITKYFSSATVGLVGNNLAFLYRKAPFDPEAVPSANSTYYTGVDFFMQPTLRNIGFNVRLTF